MSDSREIPPDVWIHIFTFLGNRSRIRKLTISLSKKINKSAEYNDTIMRICERPVHILKCKTYTSHTCLSLDSIAQLKSCCNKKSIHHKTKKHLSVTTIPTDISYLRTCRNIQVLELKSRVRPNKHNDMVNFISAVCSNSTPRKVVVRVACEIDDNKQIKIPNGIFTRVKTKKLYLDILVITIDAHGPFPLTLTIPHNTRINQMVIKGHVPLNINVKTAHFRFLQSPPGCVTLSQIPKSPVSILGKRCKIKVVDESIWKNIIAVSTSQLPKSNKFNLLTLKNLRVFCHHSLYLKSWACLRTLTLKEISITKPPGVPGPVIYDAGHKDSVFMSDISVDHLRIEDAVFKSGNANYSIKIRSNIHLKRCHFVALSQFWNSLISNPQSNTGSRGSLGISISDVKPVKIYDIVHKRIMGNEDTDLFKNPKCRVFVELYGTPWTFKLFLKLLKEGQIERLYITKSIASSELGYRIKNPTAAKIIIRSDVYVDRKLSIYHW